jgi:putative ABC transport system permease protein
MMCTAMIVHQLNFMKNRDLGFDQQNVVTIDYLNKLGNHVEAFEQYLSSLSGVSQVSKHSGEPGNESMTTVYNFKSKVMDEGMTLNTYPVDDQFIPMMNFQILQGRNFNHELASDTAAVVLNESAVKVLGLEDPVGAKLDQGGIVIGVVKDYHWKSLREEIGPSVFALVKKDPFQMSMRINNTSASNVIALVSQKWKELVPTEPFEYHFVDDNFGKMLEKERLFGRAVGFFTVLAIFVSCLGLYGLSAYTTEQRNKEIGIRKVLGASAAHIVLMLNKRFAGLVALSVLVATPIALYLMMRWMEGFAYRADMQASLFVIAILTAFAVALLTVSYHSIRASLSNPVEALKYE